MQRGLREGAMDDGVLVRHEPRLLFEPGDKLGHASRYGLRNLAKDIGTKPALAVSR